LFANVCMGELAMEERGDDIKGDVVTAVVG
jgi:hypothetical protein